MHMLANIQKIFDSKRTKNFIAQVNKSAKHVGINLNKQDIENLIAGGIIKFYESDYQKMSTFAFECAFVLDWIEAGKPQLPLSADALYFQLYGYTPDKLSLSVIEEQKIEFEDTLLDEVNEILKTHGIAINAGELHELNRAKLIRIYTPYPEEKSYFVFDIKNIIKWNSNGRIDLFTVDSLSVKHQILPSVRLIDRETLNKALRGLRGKDNRLESNK